VQKFKDFFLVIMLKKQKKYIFAPIFWDRERYLKLKRIIMEKKNLAVMEIINHLCL
jgi:hypothetical protein